MAATPPPMTAPQVREPEALADEVSAEPAEVSEAGESAEAEIKETSETAE